MKLTDVLKDVAARCGHKAARMRRRLDHSVGNTNVMLTLLRPNLGPTPAPLRRLAEPVVALVALLALGLLASLGVVTLSLFLLACALMYGILTQIFGIELSLQMPQTRR